MNDDELDNPCNMSGDDDSDFEDYDILQPIKKKKSGRKSSWMPEDIDDLVDIVVNNAYYQGKLIFTNTKCQRNAEIYEEILKELTLRALNRGSELKFTVKRCIKWRLHRCKLCIRVIQTQNYFNLRRAAANMQMSSSSLSVF